QHEQFDLPAFDEIDHFVLIATGVDISVSRNLDGASVKGLALQGITQLLFEQVCLRSLLNQNRASLEAHDDDNNDGRFPQGAGSVSLPSGTILRLPERLRTLRLSPRDVQTCLVPMPKSLPDDVRFKSQGVTDG